MLYGQYRFHCRLDRDAALPAYKGSTFRGAFGIALKQVVCALKRRSCDGCLLRGQCLYTRVFETPLALAPEKESRMAQVPHPFVIQPPATEQTDFPAGAGSGKAVFSLHDNFCYALSKLIRKIDVRACFLSGRPNDCRCLWTERSLI